MQSKTARRETEIKAVVFDFGGVVFDSPLPIIAMYEHKWGLPRLALNYFLSTSQVFEDLECGRVELPHAFAPMLREMEEKLPPIVAWLLESRDKKKRVADDAKRSEAEYAEESQRITQNAIKSMRLEELFTQLAVGMKLREPVLRSIKKLRQAGYVVAALTNNWNMLYVSRKESETKSQPHALSTIQDGGEDAQPASLKRIRGAFDRIFESYKLGRRKPAPELFAYVAKELGFAPNECLMVDDLEANLRGAREAGFSTLLAPTPGRMVQRPVEGHQKSSRQVRSQDEAALALVELLEEMLGVCLKECIKSKL